MDEERTQLSELLKDLIKINAIVGTELIQLVENSSRQIRGEIPESCKIQHATLKKEIIDIAAKWHTDCDMLREHNLGHD